MYLLLGMITRLSIEIFPAYGAQPPAGFITEGLHRNLQHHLFNHDLIQIYDISTIVAVFQILGGQLQIIFFYIFRRGQDILEVNRHRKIKRFQATTALEFSVGFYGSPDGYILQNLHHQALHVDLFNAPAAVITRRQGPAKPLATLREPELQPLFRNM